MSSLELIFSSYDFAVLGYQMCEALNLNSNYHYLYEGLHKFLQILLDTVISYDSNIIDVIFHIGPGRGWDFHINPKDIDEGLIWVDVLMNNEWVMAA